MGTTLFLVGSILLGLGILVPAFANPLAVHQRKFVIYLAILIGSISGYFLSLKYQTFLFYGGIPFGETDPIFNRDVGFYIYDVPVFWTIAETLLWGTFLGAISAIGCAWVTRAEQVDGSRFHYFFKSIANNSTIISLALFGLAVTYHRFLGAFDLVLLDNKSSAIYVGAEALDVTGFFSTLSYLRFSTLVTLGVTIAIVMLFRAIKSDERALFRKSVIATFILLACDFGMRGAVSIRDTTSIEPNEPVIQLKYIDLHLKATRKAYGLDKVEEVNYEPNYQDQPIPNIEEMLSSSTLRNAPLWPGKTVYLERLLDPQHSQRILSTQGDATIYGPSLEIFRQYQKLRTYYNFLGIDNVRYKIDGEKRMFVSGVRELPLIEPYPWLAWFGQRFMLFTHGYGFVAAPSGEITEEGVPNFMAGGIPHSGDHDMFKLDNPRIYYGEGSSSMAYSNVDQVKEFDFPTQQDRAELELPQDIKVGVKIDSFIKRLAFGWRSGQFSDIIFSDLIKDDTRVHFYRTPLERVQKVAPFLYYDTNITAIANEGKLKWMINALTTTDRYPYSAYGDLGDKSHDTTPFAREWRKVNWVRDSVKGVVDSTTGDITLYQISDDPISNTWASIYPGLFTPKDQMPTSIKEHLTYPIHLFHLQFDDLFIYYHANDPMYFFNQEDLWDDGDEVLGPVLDQGKAITFSNEPYTFMLETGKGVIPAAKEKTQFALGMVFSPEKALNLRGIPLAYQDGEDYGRLVALQVPKGYFYPGIEQADAAIDQTPEISEQISWWNRVGTDVIRGHTTALLLGNEVVYVEPLYIRSQQNPVTQLKRVVVVFRGVARMGRTLEEALKMSVKAYEDTRSPSASAPSTPIIPSLPPTLPVNGSKRIE